MDTPALYATAWAVLPPLIAIVLALITKEVYSSLFLGVVVGAVLYAGADFDGIVNHVLQDGIMASLSDSWNVGILIFLVILGIVVALMNLSGGSKAFGKWALRRVRTRVAAEIATVLLGIVIFVDDYFNCLTVGSVMKPVTDNFKVSRAKLAYIIDATAAPVCIIAPVSSWAAAVSLLCALYDRYDVRSHLHEIRLCEYVSVREKRCRKRRSLHCRRHKCSHG